MTKQVNKPAKRGRPLLNTSAHLVAHLDAIAAGLVVPVQTIRIARAKGLIEPVPVKSGNRGRPAYNWKVTGKGNSLKALIARNASRTVAQVSA